MIDDNFLDLESALRLIDGLDNVVSIQAERDLSALGGGIERRDTQVIQVPHAVVVVIATGAGAVGKALLDVVADRAKEYLKRRQDRISTVTIYDQNGNVAKRVVRK